MQYSPFVINTISQKVVRKHAKSSKKPYKSSKKITIEKHILNLRAEGLLVRIGPDKGGHWKVIDGKS